MKSRTYLIAILFCAGSVASAIAQSDTEFTKANQEYAKGNFKEAIASYEALVRADQWNANLFYDLGNAYFRTQIGHRIYKSEPGIRQGEFQRSDRQLRGAGSRRPVERKSVLRSWKRVFPHADRTPNLQKRTRNTPRGISKKRSPVTRRWFAQTSGTQICFTILETRISARRSDTEFTKANQEYAKGNFKEAIASYEALVRADQWNANLFYDLGNAYFRTRDFGRAILNYERALALDRHHPEATANLQIA